MIGGKSYKHDLSGQDWGCSSFCNVGGMYVAVRSRVGRISRVTKWEEGDQASDRTGEKR